MNNLVSDPDRLFDYAKLYAASVASILSWGFRAKDLDSFYFKHFYNFVEKVRFPLLNIL
jgi:hypothetical protein